MIFFWSVSREVTSPLTPALSSILWALSVALEEDDDGVGGLIQTDDSSRRLKMFLWNQILPQRCLKELYTVIRSITFTEKRGECGNGFFFILWKFMFAMYLLTFYNIWFFKNAFVHWSKSFCLCIMRNFYKCYFFWWIFFRTVFYGGTSKKISWDSYRVRLIAEGNDR